MENFRKASSVLGQHKDKILPAKLGGISAIAKTPAFTSAQRSRSYWLADDECLVCVRDMLNVIVQCWHRMSFHRMLPRVGSSAFLELA